MDIRFSGRLYNQVLADLNRRHPFAAERVGFLIGRFGAMGDLPASVLLTHYRPIPDDHYIDDPKVGARIGPKALTAAMQAAYAGRKSAEGIFHVHLHNHRGETRMSMTDQREIPGLLPGFRAVNPSAPHGIIILSLDHGSAWVWSPKGTGPVQANSISVIGAPIKVFRQGRSR
jgi:hypothetical protein